MYLRLDWLLASALLSAWSGEAEESSSPDVTNEEAGAAGSRDGQLTIVSEVLTVEAARVAQERAIQQHEIEKTRQVEIARLAQEEAVQVRDIERTQTVELPALLRSRVSSSGTSRRTW